MKMKIKHTDGIANVIATGEIVNGEFVGEYKFEGMTYGVTIPVSGCGIGDHDVIPILGFENEIIGEQCRQCGNRLGYPSYKQLKEM